LVQTKALRLREKLEVGKLLGRLPKLNPADYANLTVNDWIAGLVSHERSAEMLHAIVRVATYSNQPEIMSADVAIANLQTALGPGVLYLHGGWQSLVDQLTQMPGVHISTDDAADSLPEAPAVIIATGGSSVTERLTGQAFDIGPPSHAACLDLGLNRRPKEDLVIGGDVPFYFSNQSAVAKLAPSGQFHTAAIQYLSVGEDPDVDAIMAFTKYAGVSEDDIVVSRRLHQMTPISSLPTASRGGLAGRPKITDSGHSSVFLAGDWIGPVGHLADASIASAEAAAHAAITAADRSRGA